VATSACGGTPRAPSSNDKKFYYPVALARLTQPYDFRLGLRPRGVNRSSRFAFEPGFENPWLRRGLGSIGIDEL
jgi:hypothetical protein